MNTTSDVTWRRLRDLIKRRDRSTCFHCGEIAEDGHCDHLIPLSKGGTDAITNLVWSCEKCNLKKGSSFLDSSLDFESWLAGRQEISPEKPHSKRFGIIVFEKILQFFIPPYPEYSDIDFPSYDDYFDYIALMRARTLENWFRDILWPIPYSAKCAIEALDNFEREIAKSEKYYFAYMDEIVCNVCGCPLQIAKRDLYTYSYLCPAGHCGEMYHTPSIEYIDRMRWLNKEKAKHQFMYGIPLVLNLPEDTNLERFYVRTI